MLDITVQLLALLAAVVGLLGSLRHTGSWPRSLAIPLAIVVSTMSILAVVTMVHIVFDQTGVDDSSVTTEVKQRSQQPSEEETEPQKETKPRMVRETKERSFAFSRRNSHCSRTYNARWQVKATPGWEIDIHSIRDKVTVKSSRSNYDGIEDKTKDGFLVKGRVINSGDCVKVFGRVVAKDGRGSLHVTGTYIEARMVPATS